MMLFRLIQNRLVHYASRTHSRNTYLCNLCNHHSRRFFFILPSCFAIRKCETPSATVKDILKVPKVKLEKLKILNSADIFFLLQQLRTCSYQIFEDDISQILDLTLQTILVDSLPCNKLVNEVWTICQTLNQGKFTEKQIKQYLLLTVEAECLLPIKDVLKLLEDNNISIDLEICEYLMQNFAHHGRTEEMTVVENLMTQHQILYSNNLLSSLLLGFGKKKNLKGVENTMHQLLHHKSQFDTFSYYALLIACVNNGNVAEVNKAIENLKQLPQLIVERQISDIIFEAVKLWSETNNRDILESILHSNWLNNRSMKKSIFKLIQSGFCKEVIWLLKQFPEECGFSATTERGNAFIPELIRADLDPEIVVKLCAEFITNKFNIWAITDALELSLFNQKEETTWALLYSLKGSGEEIREHYFWPLLVQARSSTDPIRKSLHIVEKMVEISLTPTFQTLKEYVVPNLPYDDVERTLQMLAKTGISKTRATTPLLHVLLLNSLLEEAEKFILESPLNFAMEELPSQLAHICRRNKRKVVCILSHLIKRVDAADYGKDWAGQFLLHFASSRRGINQTEMSFILQEMKNYNLKISPGTMKILTPLLRMNSIDDPSLIDIHLEATPNSYKQLKLKCPDQMNLLELEGHLIELEGKGLNTRGVLRKLLINYTKIKDARKAAITLKKLRQLEANVSPGMRANQMQVALLEGDVAAALESYYILLAEPSFVIDNYKVIDLCSVLVVNKKADDALVIMKDFIQRDCRSNHLLKATLKNCHQLLQHCAVQEGYDVTRKMCDLLMIGRLACPSTVLFGPRITAKLLGDDLVGAVEEAEEIVSRYGILPMRRTILGHLIRTSEEKNNPNLLSSVDGKLIPCDELIDRMHKICVSCNGAIQAKYDILFSSLEANCLKSATKIFQTIEDNIDLSRINRECRRFSQVENVDALKTLFCLTKNVDGIDHILICKLIFNIYRMKSDGESILQLWHLMSMERFQIPDDFCNEIAEVLRLYNKEVPF